MEGGGNAVASGGNVTDIDSITDVANSSIDAFGKLDICVPNAGVIGGKDFNSRRDYISEDWDMTWQVNVRGVVNTADAVAEHMKERPLRQDRYHRIAWRSRTARRTGCG